VAIARLYPPSLTYASPGLGVEFCRENDESREKREASSHGECLPEGLGSPKRIISGTVPEKLSGRCMKINESTQPEEGMKTGIGTVLICLQISAVPAGAQIAGHVVISELYGNGGNNGAVYRNDYVELYNPTYFAVSLAGWSVQYASATGTGTWHTAPLGGHILPFGYYLVQLAGGTNGVSLPSPDTTGTTNLSATAGKIALVRSTTPLTGGSPADTSIVDLVGYGSADEYEGSGPAPAPGTATSLERKAGPLATASGMAPGGNDANSGNGWDSNNNAADFVAQKSLSPQNSSASPERPPDDLLPIRFGALNATAGGNSTAVISWSTISETACYGFEVQRSERRTDGFGTVSPLIPGHGTTVLTHYYSFNDPGGAAGRYYRVKEIDTNGAEWFSESIEAMPVASVRRADEQGYPLLQSYPNPFNPGTTIGYRLPAAEDMRLVIFDMLGRVVETFAEGRQTSGEHSVRWDATGVPSGVYFCRLEAEGFVRTMRLVLVR
jgi:hypothetical protein